MSQESSEMGRIEWGTRSYGEGKAVLEREEIDSTIEIHKGSVTAFPFP